jgi:hypothetical protein
VHHGKTTRRMVLFVVSGSRKDTIITLNKLSSCINEYIMHYLCHVLK